MATITTLRTDEKTTFQQSRDSLLATARADSGRPVLIGPTFGLGIPRDGVRSADLIDQRQWEKMLADLVRAGLNPGFDSLEARLPEAKGGDEGVVPIGLIHLDYLRPVRALAHALLVAERDDAGISVGGEAASPAGFETRTAFAASAVLAPVAFGIDRLPDQHRGLRVRYRLAPELLISDGPLPTDVEIDFDDGLGFRPVAWGAEEVIDYEVAGDRRVVLRATTLGGERTAAFQLSVVTADDAAAGAAAEPRADYDVTVTARIPHNGYHHWGVGHIYWGKGNETRKLRKSILLAEGFPGNNPVWLIRDYFNGKTSEGWNPNAALADALRDRGYDVMILIFDKRGATIQGNAFVYLRALQWMYEEAKVPVAALGGSMGGLIARYALAYGEDEGHIKPGEVSLLLTFDSPHQGANVPLAVQFAARYFKNHAQGVNDLLDYDCSKQMLMHQYWGEATEPAVKKTYTDFYAELEAMAKDGFPTGIKKYAICNGARSGHPICPPEAHAVTVRRNWGCGPHYHGILYATANRPLPQPVAFAECRISELNYQMVYRVDAPEGFHSRDGCAGGRAPHFTQAYDSLTLWYAFPFQQKDLNQPHNCFIPAYSALGVKWPGDAYGFIPASFEGAGKTPFDRWYATRENTQHCTVNEQIKDWVLELFPASAEAAEEAAEPVEVLAK